MLFVGPIKTDYSACERQIELLSHADTEAQKYHLSAIIYKLEFINGKATLLTWRL